MNAAGETKYEKEESCFVLLVVPYILNVLKRFPNTTVSCTELHVL